jgi:hypothetical protein
VSQMTPMSTIFQLVTILCCVTWLIAVMKVFFFEDWRINEDLSKYLDSSYATLDANIVKPKTAGTRNHMP